MDRDGSLVDPGAVNRGVGDGVEPPIFTPQDEKTRESSTYDTGGSNALFWTLSEEDRLVVDRARKIQRFLSQPFFVAQQFTGLEGKYVPLADTVALIL